jgi:hypothetical protein
MSKVCNNENCKGDPLTVMVTASPTAESNKCGMKRVVLLLCNVACLINNIKKKPTSTKRTSGPCLGSQCTKCCAPFLYDDDDD